MTNSQRLLVAALLALLALSDVPCLRADSAAVEAPARAKKAAKKAAKANQKLKDITAEQEKQALNFATTQHPELIELLDRLEEINPEQYGRAIRELYRTSEKLRLMADRNPQRHQLEISLWKLESRIRLSLAQKVMEEEAELEKNLAPLMAERRDLKRQILELERQQATTRIAEIDKQLEGLQKDPEAETARELKRIRQTVAGQMKPAKAKAKQNKKPKSVESAPDKN
jgi:hypothetical protein